MIDDYAHALYDLEAVLQGLPPQRLQRAEPELSMRYSVNKAKDAE